MKQSQPRKILGNLFATRFSAIGSFDIDKYPIANYIVFNSDIEGTLGDARARITEARAFLGRYDIKPALMIDEEGGRVSNIWSPAVPAPSPLALSKADQQTESMEIYRYIASLLSEIKIDINLFPCLDVLSEPINPVIATRSYGESEDVVGLYGKLAISAMRDSVACIAKHFPGHGMTQLDSHLEFPIVRLAREDLERTHIRPFLNAIAAGVDGIMVSHCFYESLQSEKIPASLSKEIINGYIREYMGFNGLVITDSLDMKAVTMTTEPEMIGRLAAEVDCDILLFTEFSDRLERTFETLLKMIIKEEIPLARIQVSIRRREKVLKRLSKPKPPVESYHPDFYEKIVSEIRGKAISKKDPSGILPVAKDEVVLIVGTRDLPKDLFDPGLTLANNQSIQGKTAVLWMIDPLKPITDLDPLKRISKSARQSVLVTSYEKMTEVLEPTATILTYDTSRQTQQELLNLLFKK